MTTIGSSDVSDAALAAWHASGASPLAYQPIAVGASREVAALPSRVFHVESSRSIEAYFEDDSTSFVEAAPLVAALGSPGWQVTAIVHLRRLGAAHEVFRSCDVLLQAWWRDELGSVRFTSAERA